MPFKTEIKQFNTLTKRFQRDSMKITLEIKERIKDGGLTKTEIKTLVETFGTFIDTNHSNNVFLEPHLTNWEERLFSAINQLDQFLSGLDTVRYILTFSHLILF